MREKRWMQYFPRAARLTDRFPSLCIGRKTVLVLIALQLLVLFSLGAAPGPFAQDEPPPAPGEGTPVPTPTPPPEEEDSGGILTQIFQVVFSDRTLAEVLMNIFEEAAADDAERLEAQTAQWAELLGDLLQAPEEGYFQAISQSSLYTAAAIAVPLFLLRLALYHWHRLVGEEDSGMRVVGDWVAASALAVAAGPFLDMLVALSYWMAGAALGETSQLARAFVESTSVFDVLGQIGQVSFFSPLFIIGTALGGVLAMTGMLLAFGAAQAVFFLLAVVAPPVAVVSVIPQMRWMRSLWLKAVALLALIPIIAGGIFKASVALTFLFSGGGLLALLTRLLWLWGATGFMLSLAGILGRLTLTASVGTLGKITQGVKAVVGTAALAAAAVGTGGAAAGAGAAGSSAGGLSGSGGGGAAPGGLAGSAASAPSLPGGGANRSGHGAGVSDARTDMHAQTLDHLEAAAGHTRQAGVWGALGFRGAATLAHSQARQHELAARRVEVQTRLDRFAESGEASLPAPNPGFGFSPTVNARMAQVFTGTLDEFQDGFDGLATRLQEAGLEPQMVAEMYPEDTARMVAAFTANQQAGEPNPSLRDVAEQGGANQFLQDIVVASNPGDPESGHTG